MRRLLKPGVIALLVFLPALASCAQAGPTLSDDTSPANVLFVGNSFTYYNNSLHKHYRRLLRASHPDGELTGYARVMTISGGHLPEHAGLPAMLESTEWDAVILQGHSLGPISEETAEPFREAARRFAASIRDAGAQPLFFMTWAYTGKPEMTAQLDDAYSSIGRELDAEVVPVGLAFATATRERPGIRLRITDARHPAIAGTYLAACTFFAVLQNKSPEGLAYDAGMGADTAAYLQGVAWETVVAYRERERGR
jgi:hypothetical protein